VTDAFDNYRISGMTHHGLRFDCTLFTQVQGNLWIGGRPHRYPAFFKNVLCLYPWEPSSREPGTTVREVPLYDSIADAINGDMIEELTDWVIDRLGEGPVLVHCQCGLNRSGLVVTNVLIRLGMKPQDAIDKLQSERDPTVLCNERFVAWLLQKGDSA